MSGKNDAAAVWPNESDDHVKAGRLAGAVRSEQSDDLAGARVDVHAIHHRAAAVNFHQLVGAQNSSPPSPDRRSELCGVDSGGAWPIMVWAGTELGEVLVAGVWGLDLALVFFFWSSGCWRISVRLGSVRRQLSLLIHHHDGVGTGGDVRVHAFLHPRCSAQLDVAGRAV